MTYTGMSASAAVTTVGAGVGTRAEACAAEVEGWTGVDAGGAVGVAAWTWLGVALAGVTAVATAGEGACFGGTSQTM